MIISYPASPSRIIVIYIYDISLDEKMDLPYLHTSVNMVANVVFAMFATGLLWVNICLQHICAVQI